MRILDFNFSIQMPLLLLILSIVKPLWLFAETTPFLKIIKAKATVNANNALIIDFLVQTNVPAKVRIYYQSSKSDTEKFLFIPPSQSYARLQQFSVVRLSAQTTYYFQIIAVDQADYQSLTYT